VFSRVSQALSQFVKPIASSAAEASGASSHTFQRATFEKPKGRSGPEQEQPRQQDSQSQKEQLAQVIRLPEKKADGPPASAAAAAAPTHITIPHAFVLFFREFQQRRHDVVRWVGRRVYSAATQSRPRGYRKGAMLDQKAE